MPNPFNGFAYGVPIAPESEANLRPLEPEAPLFYPPTTPGSKLQLPDEIWQKVLVHLHNPVPIPVSGPSRASIRQTHLCAASRVCKSICRRLLYTTIITDDLPSLLAHLRSTSKRRRLNQCKELYIEYTELGLEPTYGQLLERGDVRWELCGRRAGKQPSRLIMVETHCEVNALMACTADLDMTGMKVVFPKLKKLAVGAIFGKETNRWLEYESLHSAPGSPELATIQATSIFNEYLITSNIEHVCIRDVNGPLSYAPILAASHRNPGETNFTRGIHFSSNVGYPYLYYGGPMTWSSDISPSEDWQPIVDQLIDVFNELNKLRKTYIEPHAGRTSFKDTANLTIYLSTEYWIPDVAEPTDYTPGLISRSNPNGIAGSVGVKRKLSKEEQKKLGTALERGLQNDLRKQSGLKDIVRVRSISEMPRVCQCCGSGRPK